VFLPTGLTMNALHKLVNFGASPAAVVPHLVALTARRRSRFVRSLAHLPLSIMALTISNLSKTYPNGVRALKERLLNNWQQHVRPARPERRRQEFPHAHRRDAAGPRLRRDFARRHRRPQAEDEVRKVLGYLPQEFGVYPKLSAIDMLNHLAVLKGVTSAGERKEMVDALLQQTNLWDVRKKALSTYSGGMKQRFGIAQALLANPRLIIVDEPTAGLDPAERNRFLNLLASIGRDVTVILSTHIVDDVHELCSRMAIIANGECCWKACRPSR
jgi:ABC-2 type transport system ATP-binding protein